MKKRLVLVGNGDPERNVSRFIDSCDHVVRFNAMYNYFSGKVGTKLTIYCPISDVPPRRVDKRDQVPFIFELGGFPQELWLPRPSGFEAMRSEKRRGIKTGGDYGKQHIRHWGFEGKPHKYIPEELFSRLVNVIRETRPEDDPLVPSTGVVGIYWAMHQKRFADWDLYVTGFPLSRLWRGHSKGAEKELMQTWLASGRIKKIPSKEKRTIWILNHTAQSKYHSGSAKVMDNFRKLYSEHNVVMEGKLPQNCDWAVLNGEGTMHDGRGGKHVERALAAKQAGAKIALVNTVWQNMPERLNKAVSEFNVVVARESLSFKQLYSLNPATIILPDLCILFPEKAEATGLLKGVPMAKSRLHADVAKLKVFAPFNVPQYSMSKDYSFDQQVEELKSLRVYLTGQHHGVYAAALAGIPFVPTVGNTHKIQGLLEWANVDIPVCRQPCEVWNILQDIPRLREGMSKLQNFITQQRGPLQKYMQETID